MTNSFGQSHSSAVNRSSIGGGADNRADNATDAWCQRLLLLDSDLPSVTLPLNTGPAYAILQRMNAAGHLVGPISIVFPFLFHSRMFILQTPSIEAVEIVEFQRQLAAQKKQQEADDRVARVFSGSESSQTTAPQWSKAVLVFGEVSNPPASPPVLHQKR